MFLDTLYPYLSLIYKISNLSFKDGDTSSTNFYWSIDDKLDNNDSQIHSLFQDSIYRGDTVLSHLNIFYPKDTITQNFYYLFYVTDSENKIIEGNELDNVGFFIVNIKENEYNLSAIPELIPKEDLVVFLYEGILHMRIINSSRNSYNLTITDINGKKIIAEKIFLDEKLTFYSLPNDLQAGLYFVNIWNDSFCKVKKVVLLK